VAKRTAHEYRHPHLTYKRSMSSPETDRQATLGVEVVYYLRLLDGNIKIGTSTRALERIAKHKRTTGFQEVLAVEFGGQALERARHEQFAAFRTSRAEHFAPERPLLDHIESIRQQLGFTA